MALCCKNWFNGHTLGCAERPLPPSLLDQMDKVMSLDYTESFSHVVVGQEQAERIRGKPTPPGVYDTPNGGTLTVV